VYHRIVAPLTLSLSFVSTAPSFFACSFFSALPSPLSQSIDGSQPPATGAAARRCGRRPPHTTATADAPPPFSFPFRSKLAQAAMGSGSLPLPLALSVRHLCLLPATADPSLTGVDIHPFQFPTHLSDLKQVCGKVKNLNPIVSNFNCLVA